MPAAPASCPGSTAAWIVGRGELQPDLACRAFLLATDAEDHDESLGEVSYREPVRLPYQVKVRWRRLGPEAGRSMWLKILGGHLIFKSGAMGLWINRTQFAQSGYTPVPRMAANDEHLLEVTQTREQVEVRIDGAEVAKIALRGPAGAGRLAIGFNGARGYRSRVAFRDFAVALLPQ